jgi:hypothetical protein
LDISSSDISPSGISMAEKSQLKSSKSRLSISSISPIVMGLSTVVAVLSSSERLIGLNSIGSLSVLILIRGTLGAGK